MVAGYQGLVRHGHAKGLLLRSEGLAKGKNAVSLRYWVIVAWAGWAGTTCWLGHT